MKLGGATWTQIAPLDNVVLAVPVGSTEQHGPHLPFSTDTDIAQALCERLAQARTDIVVAPALPYGSSGEHDGFPGTLSIGQAATECVLVELGRSARSSFAHLVLVSAHGGNGAPVRRAARTLADEASHVLVYEPRWSGDPHAGEPETSMMLALHPRTVLMEHAVAGDIRPITETWPILVRRGVRAVSDNGVLGDPSGAQSERGLQLLERLSGELIAAVAAWLAPVTADAP